MKQLMLVKIGGGFITHKDQYKTVNQPALEHIAKEIAQFRREYSTVDLIVGNGGGSYPHYPAHKHGLNAQHWQPMSDKLAFGVAETHHHAQLINSLTVDMLQAKGVAALAFSPLNILWQADQDTQLFDLPLRKALESFCTPVLYGDMVLGENGTKIYSTEQVLYECLQEFRGQYQKITVVYFTNAEGVLDVHSKVIPKLKRDEAVEVQSVHAHDISRGIIGKVDAARQAADVADEVRIVGGWQQRALQRILGGEPVGTRVL